MGAATINDLCVFCRSFACLAHQDFYCPGSFCFALAARSGVLRRNPCATRGRGLVLIYCMLFRLLSVLFAGWFAIGDEIVKGTRLCMDRRLPH